MIVRELGSRLVASTSSHKQETTLVTKERATVTNQVALEVKNPSADAGGIRDAGLNPGSGRSAGGVKGNPL